MATHSGGPQMSLPQYQSNGRELLPSNQAICSTRAPLGMLPAVKTDPAHILWTENMNYEVDGMNSNQAGENRIIIFNGKVMFHLVNKPSWSISCEMTRLIDTRSRLRQIQDRPPPRLPTVRG
ncbi:hypothetical protein J3459_010084 [Metarhizium acridum]|nr:hypothetical protein J3459_010084 [Metarhizium acridum]